MKLFLPHQFAAELNGERSLPLLARDASARLEDGLDAEVVTAWVEKEGYSAEFAQWLILFLVKNGVPDEIDLESLGASHIPIADAMPSTALPIADIPATKPSGRVVITGGLAAAPVAAAPVAAAPVAAAEPFAISVSPPEPRPQAQVAYSGMPAQPSLLPSVGQDLLLSPLAEAFPQWNVLPPAALIKRVRRTL